MKNVVIYTRGIAPNQVGKGGWAAILLFDEYVKELSGSVKEATPNRAELTAVVEALNGLKEPCRVVILSSSGYVVDAMRKTWAAMWWHNNWIWCGKKVAHKDLWDEILALCRIHRITWTRVPEHGGIEWSLKAKLLANDAMQMPHSHRTYGYKR